MFDAGPEEQEEAGGSPAVAHGPAAGLGAAIDAVGAAVDGLAGCDPAAVPAQVLLVELVRLRAVRDRLDAEVARVAAVVDVQGAWRADGSQSAAARLAREAGEPIELARSDLRIARALAGMPLTAAAFSGGEVSRAHVDLLVGAAGGPRRRLFARDEAMLLGFARELAGSAFRRAVQAWRLAADDELAPDDPGALDLDAVGVDERRWAAVHEEADGRVVVQSELGRLDGAQFTAAFTRVDDELFRADWKEARERLGREPTVGKLRRTPGQRRADALVELAVRASTVHPRGKRPRPLVTVLIGSERHAQLLQLSRGTPITLREGLRAMLDGEIERATFETPNRVQISEKARLFTGATRRAIEVRDITCTHVTITATGQIVRCDVPADECDIDHVIPVEEGGLTTQDNGDTRCPPDHEGRRRYQPWLEGDRAQRQARTTPKRRTAEQRRRAAKGTRRRADEGRGPRIGRDATSRIIGDDARRTGPRRPTRRRAGEGDRPP